MDQKRALHFADLVIRRRMLNAQEKKLSEEADAMQEAIILEMAGEGVKSIKLMDETSHTVTISVATQIWAKSVQETTSSSALLLIPYHPELVTINYQKASALLRELVGMKNKEALIRLGHSIVPEERYRLEVRRK